jgi:uncharacterized protein (UPF0261 family)
MVIMRSGASTAATTARSRRLNRMRRLVRFRIPEADAALFDAILQHTGQTEARRIVRLPAHINDVVRTGRDVL